MMQLSKKLASSISDALHDIPNHLRIPTIFCFLILVFSGVSGIYAVGEDSWTVITINPNYDFTCIGGHLIGGNRFVYDLETGITTTINIAPKDISGNIVVGAKTSSTIGIYDSYNSASYDIGSSDKTNKNPAIDGSKVVYTGTLSGNSDIYMYDLGLGTETKLTNSLAQEDYPDISGDKVVYQKEESGIYSICLYDLNTEAELTLVTYQDSSSRPEIDGNFIVWANSKGYREVWLYDLSTNQAKLIGSSLSLVDPSISGQFILYSGYVNEMFGYVKIFDIINGQDYNEQISSDEISGVSHCISDGKAVWSGNIALLNSMYIDDFVTTTDKTSYLKSQTVKIDGGFTLNTDATGLHLDINIFPYEEEQPSSLIYSGDITATKGQTIQFNSLNSGQPFEWTPNSLGSFKVKATLQMETPYIIEIPTTTNAAFSVDAEATVNVYPDQTKYCLNDIAQISGNVALDSDLDSITVDVDIVDADDVIISHLFQNNGAVFTNGVPQSLKLLNYGQDVTWEASTLGEFKIRVTVSGMSLQTKVQDSSTILVITMKAGVDNLEIEWINGYTMPVPKSQMILNEDNTFTLSGNLCIFDYNIFLTKVKPNGETVWYKEYQHYWEDLDQWSVLEFWGNTIEAHNGGYITSGIINNYIPTFPATIEEGWVFKTDEDGNIEWEKTYDILCQTIQKTNDNAYIIAGEHSGKVAFSKIDINGNMIFSKDLEIGANTVFGNEFIKPTTDGGIIIISNTLLIKTDSMGEIEWSVSMSGKSIQQTSDGGYIIIGDVLSKTDSLGNVQWSKQVSGDYIWQTIDGGYLIGADKLIKISSHGEIEWTQLHDMISTQCNYHQAEYFYCNSVVETGENDILVSGISYDIEYPSQVFVAYLVLGTTLYDDDEAFWSYSLGGTGDIGINIEETQSIVASNTSSLKYEVVRGICEWVNIYHTWETEQDWSNYDAFIFWQYDDGDPGVYNIILECTTHSDRFEYTFSSNPPYWHRNLIPLSEFQVYGSASFDHITKIIIEYTAESYSNYPIIYLDKLYLISLSSYYHTIEVAIDGYGSVNINPSGYTHFHDSPIKLTAIPNTGYEFTEWSGDITSTTNPVTLNMDSNKYIVAHFAPSIFKIIYEDDEGYWSIEQGGTGNLGLIISEATSHKVSGSSSLRCDVVSGPYQWVNIKHSYSSNQDWSEFENLSFYWNGENTGEQFDIFIEAPNWANRFVYQFVDDFSGWKRIVVPFTGFTEFGAPDWGAVRKVVIGYSGTSWAIWYLDKLSIFTVISDYTLNLNIVGDGSVTKSPDLLRYNEGQTVELSASPGPGYQFSGWSGDLSGSGNPAYLLMDGDKTVTATFTEETGGAVEVIYEDDEGFWAAASGGTGGIGLVLSEETVNVQSGSSCLRYQVAPGSKQWVNIQHSWSVGQDWSGFDSLAFWWYGQGSGRVFSVNVEASSSTNKFSSSFVDDSAGWRRVVLPLGGFRSVGSPSWGGVRKLIIGYSGATTATWLLDRLTIEAN